MQQEQTFREFMRKTYTVNELADMVNHGVSGGFSGLIYYTETAALFDQYRDELFDLMADFQESIGADDTLPEYVRKNAGTFGTFANAAVWYCAEHIAYELTQGEYADSDDAMVGAAA